MREHIWHRWPCTAGDLIGLVILVWGLSEVNSGDRCISREWLKGEGERDRPEVVRKSLDRF